nr:unnamed protein product [Digitaria exilis]
MLHVPDGRTGRGIRNTHPDPTLPCYTVQGVPDPAIQTHHPTPSYEPADRGGDGERERVAVPRSDDWDGEAADPGDLPPPAAAQAACSTAPLLRRLCSVKRWGGVSGVTRQQVPISAQLNHPLVKRPATSLPPTATPKLPADRAQSTTTPYTRFPPHRLALRPHPFAYVWVGSSNVAGEAIPRFAASPPPRPTRTRTPNSSSCLRLVPLLGLDSVRAEEEARAGGIDSDGRGGDAEVLVRVPEAPEAGFGFRGGGDFIAPCKCKGTSKYVHRDCLDHWRAVKVLGWKLGEMVLPTAGEDGALYGHFYVVSYLSGV